MSNRMPCFNDRVSARLLILFLFLFLGQGCASSIQEPQYYLLTDPFAGGEVTGSVSNPDAGCSLTLSSVTVAPYLQKNNIVLQTEGNRLVPAVYHRWSEPLEAGATRLLQTCLNPASVSGSGEPARNVQVHLQHFHGDVNGQVVLEGSWTSHGSRGAFRSIQQQQGDGYNALVTSHRNLLLEMCLSIRTQLLSCS